MAQSRSSAAPFALAPPLDAAQLSRQESGEAWERYVAALNEACVRAGLAADVFKVHTPYRVIRDLGRARFVGVRTGCAPIDFVGCLADGRALYAEAKRCTGTSLPLARLEPRQRATLDAVERAGGVALVLVALGPALLTARVCALPWGVIDAMARDARERAGRKSVAAADLLRWETPRGRAYLAAPWCARGALPPAAPTAGAAL